MKSNALRLLLGTCISALWGTVACGADTQKAASFAEGSADVDDGSATRGAEAPAAAPMPAEQAPPPAEAARDAGGQDSPRAPTVESNAAPARKEKKLISETERNGDLRAATSAFDDSLGAKELSCEGARPHRDAICEIAKRLCELSVKTPSSGERDDCVTANHACEKAQRKYQARCGK